MTSPKLVLKLDLTEEQGSKLAKIAASRNKTMEECVIDWIETHAPGGGSDVLETLARLERMSWMNMYWASLPFSDGMPKQHLNDEGWQQLWENAGQFADKWTEGG